jgi:hypothetical protein
MTRSQQPQIPSPEYVARWVNSVLESTQNAITNALLGEDRDQDAEDKQPGPDPYPHLPRPVFVPTLGEDVHYRTRRVEVSTVAPDEPPVCRAAKVIELDDDARWVSLAVFHPSGVAMADTVGYDSHLDGDTWHYPVDCR